MTKLEFLDKINNILVGLNTLESDLLGSLYDELMRDAGWHPASELPPKSTRIIVCYKDKYNYDLYTSQSSFLTKTNEYIGVPEYAQKTLMWCYPPKEE